MRNDSRDYSRHIINSINPNSSSIRDRSPDQKGGARFDTRSAQEIVTENENLRTLIQHLKEEKSKQPAQSMQRQPDAPHLDFGQRSESNNNKIRQLQKILLAQEQVITSYQQKFKQFQQNLINIMRLDKDIHSKLVNPNTSPTLENNVKNVLTALNGKAPYDKLIKMIESIKV